MPDPIDKLLKFLESEGYTDLRTLEDGSIVGVLKMMFTWGTVVDLEPYGHGGRVCWPTYEQAANFAHTMVTIEDVPPPGYTALKRKCDMRQEVLPGNILNTTFNTACNNPEIGDGVALKSMSLEESWERNAEGNPIMEGPCKGE